MTLPYFACFTCLGHTQQIGMSLFLSWQVGVNYGQRMIVNNFVLLNDLQFTIIYKNILAIIIQVVLKMPLYGKALSLRMKIVIKQLSQKHFFSFKEISLFDTCSLCTETVLTLTK